MKHILNSRAIVVLSISISIAAVLSVLFLLGFLFAHNTALTDSFYGGEGALEEIVIVGIDDKSLQEMGRWPWPRSAYAALISKAENASVVGIDVSFFEPSDIYNDTLLADAVNKAGNVVLVSEYTSFSVRDGRLYGEEVLAPFFEGNYRTGFVNVFADDDGIVRSLPLYVNGETGKAFGTVVVEAHTGKEVAARDRALINYAGPPGSFQRLSFTDVINSRTGFDFTGKIVLIGAVAPDLRDTHFTPVSSGSMPGVEIHANAIQTILTDDFLHHQTSESVVAMIFAISILTGLVIYRFRVSIATLLVFLIAAAYAISGLVIFDTGTIMNMVYPLLAIGCTYVGNVAVLYETEHKKRKIVTNVFGKYVSEEVADEIIKKSYREEFSMQGENKEITVLFSDIRNFTSMSEKMKPEQLVRFLNRYLTAMTDVILKHRGIVDKYIGDAIMAFWGAPVDEKDHAKLACSAALDMKNKLATSGMKVAAGIGVNTGEVVVGNMGSARRVNYTVIGDSVNTASRLEGLNKIYGTSVIIGENTYEAVKGDFTCRELDVIRVKGKEKHLHIYELVSKKADLKTRKVMDHFQEGLGHYRKKEWDKAIGEFKKANAIRKDPPSLVFVERCKILKKNPPRKWDGIFTMKTK